MLLRHWLLIELDFQEAYGIDLSSGVMLRRTWRWLRLRAYGLLSTESRLQRVLRPAKSPEKKPGADADN